MSSTTQGLDVSGPRVRGPRMMSGALTPRLKRPVQSQRASRHGSLRSRTLHSPDSRGHSKTLMTTGKSLDLDERPTDSSADYNAVCAENINPDCHSLRMTCSIPLTYRLSRGLPLDKTSKGILQDAVKGNDSFFLSVLQSVKLPRTFDVDHSIPGNIHEDDGDAILKEFRVMFRLFVFEMLNGVHFLHRDASGQAFRLNIKLARSMQELEIEALAAQIYEMPLREIEELEVNVRMMLKWEVASASLITELEEGALRGTGDLDFLEDELNEPVKTFWSTIVFKGGVKIHLIFLSITDALRFSFCLDILKTFSKNSRPIKTSVHRYPFSVLTSDCLEWLVRCIGEERVPRYKPLSLQAGGVLDLFRPCADPSRPPMGFHMGEDPACKAIRSMIKGSTGHSSYDPWSLEEWEWIKHVDLVSCHKSARPFIPSKFMKALGFGDVSKKEQEKDEKKRRRRAELLERKKLQRREQVVSAPSVVIVPNVEPYNAKKGETSDAVKAKSELRQETEQSSDAVKATSEPKSLLANPSDGESSSSYETDYTYISVDAPTKTPTLISSETRDHTTEALMDDAKSESPCEALDAAHPHSPSSKGSEDHMAEFDAKESLLAHIDPDLQCGSPTERMISTTSSTFTDEKPTTSSIDADTLDPSSSFVPNSLHGSRSSRVMETDRLTSSLQDHRKALGRAEKFQPERWRSESSSAIDIGRIYPEPTLKEDNDGRDSLQAQVIMPPTLQSVQDSDVVEIDGQSRCVDETTDQTKVKRKKRSKRIDSALHEGDLRRLHSDRVDALLKNRCDPPSILEFPDVDPGYRAPDRSAFTQAEWRKMQYNDKLMIQMGYPKGAYHYLFGDHGHKSFTNSDEEKLRLE